MKRRPKLTLSKLLSTPAPVVTMAHLEAVEEYLAKADFDVPKDMADFLATPEQQEVTKKLVARSC